MDIDYEILKYLKTFDLVQIVEYNSTTVSIQMRFNSIGKFGHGLCIKKDRLHNTEFILEDMIDLQNRFVIPSKNYRSIQCVERLIKLVEESPQNRRLKIEKIIYGS